MNILQRRIFYVRELSILNRCQFSGFLTSKFHWWSKLTNLHVKNSFPFLMYFFSLSWIVMTNFRVHDTHCIMLYSHAKCLWSILPLTGPLVLCGHVFLQFLLAQWRPLELLHQLHALVSHTFIVIAKWTRYFQMDKAQIHCNFDRYTGIKGTNPL